MSIAYSAVFRALCRMEHTQQQKQHSITLQRTQALETEAHIRNLRWRPGRSQDTAEAQDRGKLAQGQRGGL